MLDLYLSETLTPVSLTVPLLTRVTEEESTATTMEALKARIRELERQIQRGDRYKCLICMVSVHMAAHPPLMADGVTSSMCKTLWWHLEVRMFGGLWHTYGFHQ